MSTIGKALTLLDMVSRLNKDAGLTEIARLCALDKATTRRLLVELEKQGFIEQDKESRTYRIGSAPVRLARIREARYPFVGVSAPFITAFAQDCAETVHLAEFSGGRLSTIYVEESPHAHRVIVEMGMVLPFHATASGLAFLAHCSRDEINAALARRLESYTNYTVTDPHRLRDMLDETLTRGFSIGEQGFETGVISAAAPIRAPGGRPVGSVAVTAPMARVGRPAMLELGAKIVATAEAISGMYYGVEHVARAVSR